MNVSAAAETCQDVLSEIQTAVIGDQQRFETILTAIVGGGHVLLEDVPGTGKTLTARTLATALDLEFKRIQFTPDLLPADITGTHVYDEQAGEFEFEEGPIFANVVLADEINRAPPKTQAALLEAMGEKQVSIGGETRELPDPFFVIATQNPVEQEGTFPLPEAQVDRFMVKTTIGYPNRDGELELLERRANRETRTPDVGSVVDRDAVLDLQTVPNRSASTPRFESTSSTSVGRPARTSASRSVSHRAASSDCSRRVALERRSQAAITSLRRMSTRSSTPCWTIASS